MKIKKSLLPALLALLIPAFNSCETEKPLEQEETGVYIDRIECRYRIGKSNAFEVRFRVNNGTVRPLTWLRFDFAVFEVETADLVWKDTFEFGSQTGDSDMRLAAFSKTFTPWKSCAMPVAYMEEFDTEDNYGMTTTGQIEFAPPMLPSATRSTAPLPVEIAVPECEVGTGAKNVSAR